MTPLLLAGAAVTALWLLSRILRFTVGLLASSVRRFRAAGRATCCTCGGLLGPVTVAVWGPDDDPRDAESNCLPCHTADAAGNPARYFPGVTSAPIGAVATWGEFDAAALAAHPARQSVPTIPARDTTATTTTAPGQENHR